MFGFFFFFYFYLGDINMPGFKNIRMWISLLVYFWMPYLRSWVHYYINIFLYMYTCYAHVVSASIDLEGGTVALNSFLLWQLYPSLCHSVGPYSGRAMLRADLNFFQCKKYMLKWYQYFFKSKNIWNVAIHLFGLIWSIDFIIFF